LRRYTCH